MMPAFKSSLFVTGVACCLATTGDCLAQQNAEIDPFNIGTQNYATIDLSGTSTNNAIDQLALDDQNNVAFSFWSGGSYMVGKWANGVLDGGSPKPTGSDTTGDTFYGSRVATTLAADFPRRINSLGSVGTLGGLIPQFGPGSGAFGGAEGAVIWPYGSTESDAVQPPWENNDISQARLQFVGSLGKKGVLNGMYDVSGYSEQFFVQGYSGVITASAGDGFIFNETPFSILAAEADGDMISCNAPIPSLSGDYVIQFGVDIGYAYYNEAFISDPGWTQFELPYPDGYVTAFNDQHDALVSDLTNGSYLYENLGAGTSGSDEQYSVLPLASMIPALALPHLSNISPFMMSNRLPNPTNGSGQPVLNILFSATFEFSPQKTEQALFLLRLFSDGTTDLNKIGVYIMTSGGAIALNFPTATGLTLSSINSSGIIAAIGNGGHALLLVPVNFQLKVTKQGTWITDTFQGYEERAFASVPAGCGITIGGIWRDIQATDKFTYRDNSTYSITSGWLSDTPALAISGIAGTKGYYIWAPSNPPTFQGNEPQAEDQPAILFSSSAEVVDLNEITESFTSRWYICLQVPGSSAPGAVAECDATYTSVAKRSIIGTTRGPMAWQAPPISSSLPALGATIYGAPWTVLPISDPVRSTDPLNSNANKYFRLDANGTSTAGLAVLYHPTSQHP